MPLWCSGIAFVHWHSPEQPSPALGCVFPCSHRHLGLENSIWVYPQFFVFFFSKRCRQLKADLLLVGGRDAVLGDAVASGHKAVAGLPTSCHHSPGLRLSPAACAWVCATIRSTCSEKSTLAGVVLPIWNKLKSVCDASVLFSHTAWLQIEVERECAFLTTAKYDWRWGYHIPCNLLLNGHNACGWLRASAHGQIRQTNRSCAGRLFPAYSPLWLGLKDTRSKCLREGLSVHHHLEPCGTESLAACLRRVVIRSTSLCWKPRDDDDSEAGVCCLGDVFCRVSELMQLAHGCKRALGKMG